MPPIKKHKWTAYHFNAWLSNPAKYDETYVKILSFDHSLSTDYSQLTSLPESIGNLINLHLLTFKTPIRHSKKIKGLALKPVKSTYVPSFTPKVMVIYC